MTFKRFHADKIFLPIFNVFYVVVLIESTLDSSHIKMLIELIMNNKKAHEMTGIAFLTQLRNRILFRSNDLILKTRDDKQF